MRRQIRRWLAPLRSTWERLRWNFARFFGQLGRLVGWLFYRVGRWIDLRRSRYVLRAMPALLAFVGVAVVAGMVFLHAQEQRVQHYQAQGNAALQANNPPLAQVCYERLSQLAPDRPEFRFLLALTLQAQGENDLREAAKAKADDAQRARELNDRARGQFERVTALMGQLATPDRAGGHAPAHVWWAQRLIATRQPNALAVSEQHLRRALETQPDNAAANALLGQLYLATNRLDQAEAPLRKALPSAPALNLDLARLYASRNDKVLARNHGDKALRYFQQLADASVDNHAARLQWHESALFLGDFPEAVRILEDGLRLTNYVGYCPALARALVIWSDAVARLQPDKKEPKDNELKVDETLKLTSRIALLERALDYDYGNLTALTRLMGLSRSTDAAEAEQARTALRGQLAAGKNPATVHLVLGMDAQRRQQMTEAREHFEQAYKLSPDMPILINNLAWTMAFSEKPDLPEALELIEGVLKRQPNNPRFRETRGQVLVKLGKHKEALPDLEAGLRVMSGNAGLHRALAETYEKLGDSAMAAEHRRRAEQAGGKPEAVAPPDPKPGDPPTPKPVDPKSATPPAPKP